MTRDVLDTVSETALAQRTPRIVIAAAAAIVTLLFAGAAVLWAHYGTAVFFEMIRAGFAACF